MARILLVDDDASLLEAYKQWLTVLRCEVLAVATGMAALQAATSIKFTAAVTELCLPDVPGLVLVEELRPRGVGCIVVTGHGSCRTAVCAMRSGASNVLEKPIDPDTFVAAVNELIDTTPHYHVPALGSVMSAHSLERWAIPVIRLLNCSEDPRTLNEWGRMIGMSTGAIRNWCRTAKVSARQTLLFARVLRAVLRQNPGCDAPEHLLNIVDRRTLTKVLTLSGGDQGLLPQNVETFLRRQQFISNLRAVSEIREALLIESRGNNALSSVPAHPPSWVTPSGSVCSTA